MTEYTPQLGFEAERKRPNYVAVFALLAIVTLFEVTLFREVPAVLVLLSVTKVSLVAMYYMHLKFETGWFTALFLFPIPLMLLVIVVIAVALAPSPDGVAAAGGVCSFW
jgi:hypothetical protein